MRNFEIVNFVFKRRKFEPESPNLSAKRGLPRAYKRLERVLAASSLGGVKFTQLLSSRRPRPDRLLRFASYSF